MSNIFVVEGDAIKGDGKVPVVLGIELEDALVAFR